MTPPRRHSPYLVLMRDRLRLPRPRTGDALLAAAFVALGQAVTWLQLDSPDSFAGARPVNAVLSLLAMMPFVWRRTAPLAALAGGVLLLCAPHAFAALDVTVLATALPLIVLTASAGYHAERRPAVLGLAAAVAGFLLVSWTTPFLRTPESFGFNFLMLTAPWAAARGVREREERARRLGAALATERAERETRMAEVVVEERARVARELHDIVAHGVSVMVVQVGGARLQLTEDPERAARSLLHAEEAGRQALSDLRQLVGVLRATGPQAPSADPGPLPGLGQLPALLDQVRAAGLEAVLTVTGTPGPVPPMIDLSSYRIVQEALTNIIKHTEATRARVVVDHGPGRLRLQVTDDGPRRARHPVTTGGHGIVGIEERVALLHGSVRVGPRADHGWAVEVEMPIAPRTAELGSSPATTGAPL
jgi:signal transduction histidine kinase